MTTTTRSAAAILALLLPLSLLAAPARAENLLPNSGFDSSLAPWITSGSQAIWTSDDAAGSATSGSIQSVNDLPVGGTVGISTAFSPCVPVAPGVHDAIADYRLPTGQGVTGRASVGFRWYSDAACTALVGASDTDGLKTEDSTGAWTRVSDTITVTEGAAYITGELSLVRDQPGSITAHYDNVLLCPQGTPCAAPSSDGWITDAQYPDFRFRVQITPPGVPPIQAVKEASCQPEVVCVSGALPGRSEVFLRVIGPRPNGYLWPTIVRFTPSRVDVEIEQLSTGVMQLYTLDTVPPGTETDLSGFQDRKGFLP